MILARAKHNAIAPPVTAHVQLIHVQLVVLQLLRVQVEYSVA